MARYKQAFTTGEASAELGVSPRHLQRLIRDGELEAFDVAIDGDRPKWRISKSSIASFKARRNSLVEREAA